jgi:hypothetical protein
MKILIILLLSAATAHSQELTADTPAIEPSLLSQIAEALWAAVAVLIGIFIRNAIPLLNAYLKQVMHFRGASVVADALTQAIAELSTELQTALADGKLDAAEMAALKMRARQIAEAKLKNLSGFYKADLIGWIDDQLNVALAKLLALGLGSQSR